MEHWSVAMVCGGIVSASGVVCPMMKSLFEELFVEKRYLQQMYLSDKLFTRKDPE